MNTKTLSLMSLLGLLAASPLVNPVQSARAEDALPKPADADLLNKKTVSVLPVLATGPSRKTTFLEVASTALVGDKKAPLMPGAVTSVEAGTGFGFAGASTDKDIALLQLGFLVGSLPLNADDPKAFSAAMDMLGPARALLAGLAPGVVSAYDRYVASARGGSIDVPALAALFEAAEGGIATGPQRGHGYLTGGLWFGLAIVGATQGQVNPAFVSMASPLAVLFEEDAEFEGSDRKLAASLRQVAGLLKAETLDVQAFSTAVSGAFKVSADAPAP